RPAVRVLDHLDDAEDVPGLVARAGARPVVEERGNHAGPRAGRGRVGRARLVDELVDCHLDEQQREATRIVQAEAEAPIAGARIGTRGAERPEGQIELAVLEGAEGLGIGYPGRKALEPVPDRVVDQRAVEAIKDKRLAPGWDEHQPEPG